MKLAVSQMMFSPPLSTPMTYDHWMQVTESLDGCMEARSIQWLYSLVSVQGDRSLCVYQVPYVEALREAYREGRMPVQQMWAAEMWGEKNPQSFTQDASVIIVESNYDPPINKTMIEAIKYQNRSCMHELNVQSAFSVLSLDGTHSACAFSASSAEQVRSLSRKLGIPFERVWKATLIRNPVE